MSQDKKDLLAQFLLLQPAISIWTASRRLYDEDLGTATAQLPSRGVATRGVIHIFPKDELKPFHRAKRELISEIEVRSIRFAGGYLVPRAEYGDVRAAFVTCESVFNSQLAVLENGYDTILKKFIQDNPKEAQLIEAKSHSWATVKDRFACALIPAAVSYAGDPESDGDMDKALDDLEHQLLREIATQALVLWDGMKERDAGTTRLRPPIERIRKKLDAMKFVGQNVQPLIDVIDQVLKAIPVKGTLSGPQFAMVFGLAGMLQSPESALATAANVRMSGDATKTAIALGQTKAEEGPAAPVSTETMPTPQAGEESAGGVEEAEDELCLF